jgi:hypothetical protein
MKTTKVLMMAAFTIFSISVFAQTSTGQTKQKADTTVVKKDAFVCPMHKDITSPKPGKCSKCGMDLKAKKA